MTIGRVIQGRDFAVVTCDVEARVGEAVALLAEQRIGALPVLRDGAVVGLFSERDVIYRLHSHGPAMLDERVGDVMTAPVVTLDPETSVLAAMAQMTRRRIRHFPVMANGEMIGFVSIGDLVKYRIGLIETEAEALRAYIQTA